MRGWALAAVISLLVVSAPARAESCSQPRVIGAGNAVNGARVGLLVLPTGDGMQTDVSVEAQSEIAAMKTKLADFVSAYMACASSDTSAQAVTSGLLRAAHADAPPPNTSNKGGKPGDAANYGFDLSFKATRPAQNLIAITPAFQIECGEDTMLMIFARQGGAWREVLGVQSDPYKTVAGAWDFFDYAISPPDSAGHWFVVTKSIKPWCSSTWSEIDYAIWRPADGGAPKDDSARCGFNLVGKTTIMAVSKSAPATSICAFMRRASMPAFTIVSGSVAIR